MLRDINGQRLEKGGMALLLVQVVDFSEHDEPRHVRIRVANSDLEMAVGARFDEALGGVVADSELTAFVETPAERDQRCLSAFE
jgi:hypothetical protein